MKMKIWQKVMEKSLNFELSQMSHLFREACVDDNLHTLLTPNTQIVNAAVKDLYK